jgi:3-isopropylmalate/(R)-2-methylmalate dehydratase small subunit
MTSMRTPLEAFSSSYVVLAVDNVDTDQIIPARFLKTIERVGLGRHAFSDWRTDAAGTPRPAFSLERGAQVLVTGRNFGCGSSREHAVWALMDAGVRAIVSASFADIFRANALGNGLLPIEVSDDVIEDLSARAKDVTEVPRVAIDLATQTLSLPDGRTVTFPIPPFARHCLLNGIDELGFLVGAADEIGAYEARHPAPVSTRPAKSA